MPGLAEKPTVKKKFCFHESLVLEISALKQKNIPHFTKHNKVKTSLFKKAFPTTQETSEITSSQLHEGTGSLCEQF